MPHGGGGGSHHGGSHSSSHSSHSSHHSGGGSHGGGSHSSSHHSYGGGSRGGRETPPRPHYRRRFSYFPGAHRYVYYRHHRPYYYYSDAPTPDFWAASHIVASTLKLMFSVFFLFPTLFACLIIVFSSSLPSVSSKLTADYDKTIVIEDNAGIFEDTSKLQTAMDTFLETTGVTPAVITVHNDEWESYYDSLELYAYELYVNYFTDEYHFLIVYSEPEEADEAFNDWYWECMAGDNTDSVLTDDITEEFTEALQANLLASSRYTVDEAIAGALTETATLTTQNGLEEFDAGTKKGALIAVIVIVVILWLMFFAGRGKRKAMRKATRVPDGAEPSEVKCEYCGGVYVRGTCTECPHCGAPVSHV